MHVMVLFFFIVVVLVGLGVIELTMIIIGVLAAKYRRRRYELK